MTVIYLSIEELHHALSLLYAFFELTHVPFVEVAEEHFAFERLPVLKLTGELVAVAISHDTLAALLALLEVASVDTAVRFLELAVAGRLLRFLVEVTVVLVATVHVFQYTMLLLVVFHLAHEEGFIQVISQGTGTVHLVLLPHPFVIVVLRSIIGPTDHFTRAMLHAVLKVSRILRTVRCQRPVRVKLAVLEISLVVQQDDLLELVHIEVHEQLTWFAFV